MLKRSVKNLSVLACAVEGGLLGSNAHRTGINGLVVNGSENSSIFARLVKLAKTLVSQAGGRSSNLLPSTICAVSLTDRTSGYGPEDMGSIPVLRAICAFNSAG